MLLRRIAERLTRQRQSGQPPALPDPPPPAYYLESDAIRNQRRALNRAAVEALKRELIDLVREHGTVRVLGGCDHLLRAQAELIAEGRVQEGRDTDGHMVLITMETR